MKRLLLFSFFSFLLSGSLFSKGIRGGNVTVKLIDSFTYEVTGTLLVDCDSASLYVPDLKVRTPLGIINPDSQWLFSVKNITGIAPGCPDKDKCNGSFPYGIQERKYKAIFNLNSKTYCEVRFFMSKCCRVSTITTGIMNTPFYVETLFNTCVNSPGTPEFGSAESFVLACHNQDIIFPLGFSQSNGQHDSISYDWTGALSDSITMINPGPYPPERPMRFLGYPNQNLNFPAGLHLDPVTGIFACRFIDSNQSGVICIRASVWKIINGVPTRVHTVMREVVVQVVTCVNKNPNLMGPTSFNMCAGQKKCITLAAEDPDLGDTVKLKYTGDINGAVFMADTPTGRRASATFCWTPDSTHISNVPYIFTVNAMDNACPLAGSSSRAYSIYVRESPVVKAEITYLSCGLVRVNGIPAKNYPNTYYTWKVMDSSKTQVHSDNGLTDTFHLAAGKYYFSLQAMTSIPCITSTFDSLTILPYGNVDLSGDTGVCAGDSVLLTAVSSETIQYYNWTLQKGAQTQTLQTTGNFLKIYADSFTRISVKAHIGPLCYLVDSINVNTWKPTSPVLYAAFCPGDSVLIGAVASGGFSYNWNTTDTASEIWVKAAGNYILSSVAGGCRVSDTIKVEKHPFNVSTPLTGSFCPGDSVLVGPAPAPGLFYSWNTGDTSARIWVKTPGKYTVAASYKTCFRKDTVNVEERPFYVNPVLSAAFCPGDSVQIGPAPDPSYSFSWNTGDTVARIWTKVPGNYILTSSFQGCIKYDTVKVKQHPLNSSPTLDAAFCSGDSVEIGPAPDPAYSFTWNTGETTARIWIKTAGNYIVSTALQNCSQTDTVRVKENMIPALSLPAPFFGCEVTRVKLEPLTGPGTLGFGWNTGDTTESIWVFKGDYTLTVTDSNGCKNSASTTILPQRTAARLMDTISACVGDEINVYDSAGTAFFVSLEWDNGSQNIAYEAIAEVHGEVYATIENIDGCHYTDTFYASIFSHPDPDIVSQVIDPVTVSLETDPSPLGWTYFWDFGDTTFSSQRTPVKTYAQPGYYRVIVLTAAGSCISSDTSWVLLNLSAGKVEKAPSFMVFPNPFEKVISVSTSLDPGTEITLLLYDLGGRSIGTVRQVIGNTGTISWDPGYLAAGSYILKVQTNEGERIFHLIH